MMSSIDSSSGTFSKGRIASWAFCCPIAVPGINPWIPYYGYGAGVVRLSLGDNSELGGNVGGGYVRWNFFTDTTVTIDGEVWKRSVLFPASNST